MMDDCMICDLYAVIDKQLSFSDPETIAADFAADLVTVLPPRGHGFHNLALLEGTPGSSPGGGTGQWADSRADCPTYHEEEDVIGFCADYRHPWGCQGDSPSPRFHCS